MKARRARFARFVFLKPCCVTIIFKKRAMKEPTKTEEVLVLHDLFAPIRSAIFKS